MEEVRQNSPSSMGTIATCNAVCHSEVVEKATKSHFGLKWNDAMHKQKRTAVGTELAYYSQLYLTTVKNLPPGEVVRAEVYEAGSPEHSGCEGANVGLQFKQRELSEML